MQAAGSAKQPADAARERRREAAAFIEAVTKVAVPYSYDTALRETLRDGSILCKLLNGTVPGHLDKVRAAQGGAGRPVGPARGPRPAPLPGTRRSQRHARLHACKCGHS